MCPLSNRYLLSDRFGISFYSASLSFSDYCLVADNFTTYPKGNPYWLGRIMFGLGKHSSLVTGGYVQNAALCPGGMQDADNISFNNYCMVVPRLKATVARAKSDADLFDATTEAYVTKTFTAADEALGTADANGVQETFVFASQDGSMFDATCPEGHKWPDNDNDFWTAQ